MRTPGAFAGDQTAGLDDPIFDHVAVDKDFADPAHLIADEDVARGFGLERDGGNHI